MVDVQRLVWDEWNIAHIARHDVVPEEVADVCHGSVLVQEGKKGRVALVGPTANGRMLTVFLTPQDTPGVFYPVTARPTSRKERRLYQQEKGGET